LDRRPFAGYPDKAILKRIRLAEPRVCAFCEATLPSGALADTRDHESYFCDSREEMLWAEGHRKQAGQSTLTPDLGGAF
jgi:hypothetical protein